MTSIEVAVLKTIVLYRTFPYIDVEPCYKTLRSFDQVLMAMDLAEKEHISLKVATEKIKGK